MGLLKFLCKEDIKTKLFTIGHLSMMPSLLNVSPLLRRLLFSSSERDEKGRMEEGTKERRRDLIQRETEEREKKLMA